MISNKGRRSRGQALVEFALVAPWLFLVLFGIIEFARFVYYAETLNDAAREGARYAIVHGSDALCPSGPMPGSGTAGNSCDPTGQKVVDTVKNYAIGVIRDASFVSTVTWPDGNNQRGSMVTVSVAYEYHTLVPLVPLPPIGIDAEANLVINH